MVLQLCGRVCRCLFLVTLTKRSGLFFFIGAACRLSVSIRCPACGRQAFFRKPYSFIWIGFFVLNFLEKLIKDLPNREVKPETSGRLRRWYCSYVGEYVADLPAAGRLFLENLHLIVSGYFFKDVALWTFGLDPLGCLRQTGFL